ncbi:MAG: hypothetical protein WBG08_00805 [Litorimonas sp.]
MKLIFQMFALVASAALAACSASPDAVSATDDAHAGHAHMEAHTVKPGAAVQFSYTIDGTLSVGAFTDVVVGMDHAYSGETVTVSASATEGLDVLSSSAEKRFDTASAFAEPWRIAIRPSHDGVHYLTLTAVVDDPSGAPDARVQSIRIDLGGKTIPTDPAGKPTLTGSEDGQVAVLRASETIESADR